MAIDRLEDKLDGVTYELEDILRSIKLKTED